MKRRKFSQEYKFEAVKLVRDLGVTAAPRATWICTRTCCANGSAKRKLIRTRRFRATTR